MGAQAQVVLGEEAETLRCIGMHVLVSITDNFARIDMRALPLLETPLWVHRSTHVKPYIPI